MKLLASRITTNPPVFGNSYVIWNLNLLSRVRKILISREVFWLGYLVKFICLYFADLWIHFHILIPHAAIQSNGEN